MASITGTDGDDDLDGGIGADVIQGLAGADYIRGFSGPDLLQGGDGNDNLNGGRGADTLEGGAGFDLASYWLSGRGLRADLQNPDAGTGEAKGDSYASIEGLEGSYYDDVLRGDGNSNDILGASGDDRLFGRGGDDFLAGGAGADQLDGGDGLDFAGYWESETGLTADLLYSEKNTGEAQGDSYAAVEGLIGTGFDDILRGDGAANIIFGNGGDDLLAGRNGSDTLSGGGGADHLNGGKGEDFAIYAYSPEGVTVDLKKPEDNTGAARGDSYAGIEGLAGSGFDDVLRGDDDANQIEGMGGNDLLYGRDGKDVLTGMDGADDLRGGNGADGLRGGKGADDLRGGKGADSLSGDRGDDILRGGGGGDRLNGGLGDDRLSGGDGSDEFVFKTGYGLDTVTDMRDGDIVELKKHDAVANFTQLMNLAAETAAGLEFSLGKDTLVLEGLGLGDVDAGDFVF